MMFDGLINAYYDGYVWETELCLALKENPENKADIGWLLACKK